ncbi:VanZ family protein [Kibdelosporangium aridum]|uniref:VanZ family protein n=1 Tax=Kibdelosporangium aridum TaxID=2030 RepID=A0A428ZB46_KIBAR|nr:VanZ family protein [Kibdelosporangium aridum]RSM85292.1 VanZ family protein [Kibdelosporangium aridum]
MIAVFLIENPLLVPVLMLLMAIVCTGIGYLLLKARRQWILWTLTALSVVPVVALTLVPTRTRRMDDIPFCTPDFHLPTLASVEMVANVGLLFPLVYFSALLTRRPLLMLAAGVALSAGIETLQALVRSLGRACTTGDWAMNSAGATCAALLAGCTIALADRATAKRAASTRFTSDAETVHGDQHRL